MAFHPSGISTLVNEKLLKFNPFYFHFNHICSVTVNLTEYFRHWNSLQSFHFLSLH